ncbi:MAG: metallophosphoesterase family protein [Thermomicrobiales bacterium]
MSNLPAIRVAHIADTHLGYRALNKVHPETERNQRAIDIELAFERAIDGILAEEPDLVVHAGDVFHHTRPSWHAMRVFVRQMRRLEEAKIPAVIITGNHDSPRLRTGGTVFSVLELALPSIDFVTEYEAKRVRFPDLGVIVHAVPHGALSLSLYDPVSYTESGARNILLLHGMIPGMDDIARYEPGTEEITETLLDAAFEYIALGHFHMQVRPRANAWYAGSTERMGWGDEPATPGFLLAEFAEGELKPGTPKHKPIEARTMRTLDAIDGEGLPAREIANQALHRLAKIDDPNTMTRIELRNTARPVRREVEQLIKRALEGRVWSLDCFVRGDFLAPKEQQAPLEADVTDVRSLFTDFVDERLESRVYDEQFASSFREHGLTALNSAIERVSQALAEEDR